ncbi:trypsin, alkaline C-like [Trichoplusia ni]|uniref:Trypsin, alkaline C-like n=1 Tax=Trichoplusia ni TaxID=7111 RepID=A0A7E5WWP5_TRINI|nr:trypsin, alkaline C-like [Trichoplusia ni]XP_026744924.1 trypsin, alkaline C-like [Trichoplusia ni]
MRIAVLALVVVAVAAAPSNPSRIAGGDLTTIDKYPSMAAVLMTRDMINFQQNCGGTIINNRSILSAAHCVYGETVESTRVRIGSSYRSSGGEVLPLAAILMYPTYTIHKYDDDVAILRTAVEIKYSATVQPAPIAGPSYDLADDEVVWATGWGATETNEFHSEQLRDVQVWTVKHETCRWLYLLGVRITTDMLCIGWLGVGGRDQCWGDSGGPVFHNGVVVGVCAFGGGCRTPQSHRYPSVNARVSSYSTWIQANA